MVLEDVISTLGLGGIEEDLRGADLDAETENWANVDDFRWLRAVQSPNWSILPENERVGIVDISNSGSSDRNLVVLPNIGTVKCNGDSVRSQICCSHNRH